MATPRRSVLALAVLSMLSEQPMHPYRMQQLIKERHKEDVVNVSQRTSIYQTIERLLRDGQCEVASTERSENRPERTTYRITAAGRATLREWLLTMLSIPAAEFPEFPAALSFLPNLSPQEAIEALISRRAALAESVQQLTSDIAQGATFLPPIFLVETEYQLRIVGVELSYVTSLVEDIRATRITWPEPTV